MIKLKNKKDKKIGILGLARTGEATYIALKPFCDLLCYDDLEKNRNDFAEKYGMQEIAPISDPKWQKLDEIILSPGIPTSLPKPHPIIALAKEHKIRISSDIDLLYSARPHAHYIAITGTNGKSTTTALIHHILSSEAVIARSPLGPRGNPLLITSELLRHVVPCNDENLDPGHFAIQNSGMTVSYDIGGNIGNAVLNMNTDAAGYVLELSSYQIELLKEFRANIAIILNITPDHLDRHGTIENYANVKKTLCENIAEGGTNILSIDNDITDQIYEELKCRSSNTRLNPELDNTRSQSRCLELLSERRSDNVESITGFNLIPISTKKIIKGGVCVKDGIIYDYIDGSLKEYPLIDNKSLQGAHNMENIAAAFAAVATTRDYWKSSLRGASGTKQDIIRQIASFKALPHRMQFLGTKAGIDFYNDSKATNAEAAEKSITALRNIYLLAGGVPKEGGLTKILHLHKNITKAYLFGEAKELFASQLKGKVEYNVFATMDKAFAAALKDAKSSTSKANILLAPACASLDQFKNFEERGCHFINLYDNI